MRNLVLIGGGHSHAIALRMFGMSPLPEVRLSLISEASESAYSGMLPGHVAGFYSQEACHINLSALADFADAQLLIDRAVGLDLANKKILCANHPPIQFDWVSIDIGSTPQLPDLPGILANVIPAKPVSNFLKQWNRIIQQVKDHPDRPLQIAIVGGGAGGVELALNMQHRLQSQLTAANQPLSHLHLHLFQRGDRLLAGQGQWASDRLHQILIQRGIHLHLNQEVVAVAPHYLLCQSGFELTCDEIIWVTHATAPGWLKEAGLSVDENGFIRVNDALQSVSHPEVFAAGDVATMINHPRPKAGVFAVRQGKPLFENLCRVLQGQPLQPYHPPQRYLSLIGTGDRQAIAAWGDLGWQSPQLWTLKDWIDQRFMRRLNELPAMGDLRSGRGLRGKRFRRESPSRHSAERGRELAIRGQQDLDVPEMYCAGCGSKLGSTTLNRVLQRIREEGLTGAIAAPILVGLDSPDDAAVFPVPEGKVLVQTVDYFSALINDPFVFGQIAANHALSDLFAMGATPHSALAIATLPYDSESHLEETLFYLLAGAMKVLQQANATLIGGHTTQGETLAFGLTCNGLADEPRLLRKSGIVPGQALILTKALGTGTLFAAKMRLQAQGRWIERAVESMLQSNQQAAQCLINHGATACTDVTGFGLLGHLVEMVQASKVAASLNLANLPLLPGAQETTAIDIFSSLYPQNLKASRFIANLEAVRQLPQFPLLFDPQTSGGLLASVPAESAESCRVALHNLGYENSAIAGYTLPLTDPAHPIIIC